MENVFETIICHCCSGIVIVATKGGCTYTIVGAIASAVTKFRICPSLHPCMYLLSEGLVYCICRCIDPEHKMSREGDWNCSSCQHMNFKRRDSCQACGCPKFASADDISSYGAQRQVMPGDWYCNVVYCGAHNYASRTSCYQCSSFKDDYGGSMMGSNTMVLDGCSLPGWKTGDWVCSRIGCGAHNYACRTGCYKCSSPRDFCS